MNPVLFLAVVAPVSGVVRFALGDDSKIDPAAASSSPALAQLTRRVFLAHYRLVAGEHRPRYRIAQGGGGAGGGNHAGREHSGLGRAVL